MLCATVDDAATSDSLPRSDVFPRCVWRATSGSASDGYRASSSDRCSREYDSAYDATKSLVDHLGSHDGQPFPVSHACLSREPGSCALKAFAASDGVAIERNLFPEALSAVAEETENCWLETRTKGPKRPNFLTIEDYENQASPTKRLRRIRPWGTRGERGQQFREQQRRGEEIRGSRSCLAATRTCSSARTGKDGRKHARGSQTSKCTANKIRDSQDPGVARNIRPRILRLERLVRRQQCEGFGSGQTSHGVHELAFFRGPPGVERRETLGQRPLFFFPTFSQLEGNRLARSFRALKGWRKASPSFSRRPLLAAVWSALAVDMCRIGGTLAAFLKLVMFEAYLRSGEMLSLKPSSFLAPDGGGVRSWVILLFPQARTGNSKTGEADDTISLDSKRCLWTEPVFERLQQRQPQDKVFLNLNYAEYLLLLRRAAANLQVDMVPYQGRDSGASVDRAENLRTLESIQEPRTMEISQVCAPLRKKGTCQPKLVRARSIGPGTMRALQQPPALSIASRSRLSDTASTAPSFVIDLFSANTDVEQDVEQFFLNRGVQCAKLDLFSDDNTISTSVQEILGILASGRTLAVMVSPPVSSLSVARNHRPLRSATRPWRLPALKFSCKCQVTKDSLCVAACLRVVRACIS